MGHKGHWGEYTGNAKWSRDHAHTRVTSKNYDDAVRDDAAHIDYLKRDINYDAKHGHNDENMTADEKHISKLAGDIKYDKKHHSPATHPAGSSGRKQEHEHPHGKGKLVYTDQGQPKMSAFHKHDEWQKKIDEARAKDGDNPDFYEKYAHLYEGQEKAKQAHKKEEKRNAAPQEHCMGDK